MEDKEIQDLSQLETIVTTYDDVLVYAMLMEDPDFAQKIVNRLNTGNNPKGGLRQANVPFWTVENLRKIVMHNFPDLADQYKSLRETEEAAEYTEPLESAE